MTNGDDMDGIVQHTPPLKHDGLLVLSAPLHHRAIADVPLVDANEVATFVTQKRLDEHLSGRWLLGQALHRWGIDDLSSIEVCRTERRAPYLAFIQGVWKRTPLPNVSIAHSHDRVFVALIPPSHRVGIDAEPRARTLAANAYDMMAKGEELATLREHPSSAMVSWTAKEAVQKALGMGMHLNPRDIQIPIGLEQCEITIEKSNLQLVYWSDCEYHLSLATTPAIPSEATPEDVLLEATARAMAAQPDWGVGCKTQRNNA